eukprot:TRINITY_DN1072_c0_g1_i2.p1 TRINITY_DN1072_c0_g1~~TRINITY_DN1072_c0_g1_i2.p1  ORF type:complete len:1509 (-),score=367.26 TRINITY_DN1072_c0_g1_i2:140-4666(-)
MIYSSAALFHKQAFAVKREDVARVRAVIDADPKSVAQQYCNGNSALHLCAHTGEHAKATVLLAAGAPTELVNELGHTPLHVAAYNDNVAVAQLLLAYGANPNAVEQMEGTTPLLIACKNGFLEMARTLVCHSADVNIAETRALRTPLMYACLSRSTELIGELVRNGADVNKRDKMGGTALLYLYYVDDYENGAFLVSHGADINAQCDLGLTALHVAAVDGRTITMGVLIGAGAAIEEHGSSGMRPLHFAAWYGMEKSLETLLEHGAQIEAQDASGMTALHWAAKSLRVKTCEILVEAGATIDSLDHEGHSPLYYAFLSGGHHIASLLIQHGAEYGKLVLPSHARLNPPPCRLCGPRDHLLQWIENATQVDMSTIRLMVIGHGRAGKSTLIHSLNAIASRTWKMKVLSQKPPPVAALDSSVGVDIFHDTFKLHDKIQFSIWDFAGQLEYLPMHQYFLCETNSVYLVVVDVSQSFSKIESQLEHWIRYLEDCLPVLSKGKGRLRYVVQVVGSQADKLSKKDMSRVRSLIEEVAGRSSLPLSGHTLLVSGKYHRAVDELLERVVAMAKYLLSERMQQYIPPAYVTAIARLRSLVDSQSIPLIVTSTQLEAELKCDHACVEFLRVLGLTVGAEDMVCVQPQVLAKILSSFVCESADHIGSLLRGSPSRSLAESARKRHLSDAEHGGSGKAVVREETCLALISAVLESINTVNIQKEDIPFLLHALQKFRLCFRLRSKNEEVYGHGGYLFPSLLPEGELFVLPFVPPCLAPDHSPVSSWTHRGVRFSALGDMRITQKFFLDLIVRAFDVHDAACKLYVNGFMIRDYYDRAEEEAKRRAMLRARSNSDDGEVLDLLDAHGPFEEEMKGRRELNRGLVVLEGHTVVCVVHGPDPLHLLARLKGYLAGDEEMLLRTAEMSEEEVNGYLGNLLWSPMGRGKFYEEGKWEVLTAEQEKEYGIKVPAESGNVTESERKAERRILAANAPPTGALMRHNRLQMTDLCFNEQSDVRRREFERVRKWFYSFVGKDRVKDFQLDRIVFLSHREREREFLQYYNHLLERVHSKDGGRAHLRNMTAQQKRTLSYLKNYQGRVSGSEQVNLVMAWHANTQRRLIQSAANGIWIPRPLTKEQQQALDERKPVDFGFYGRGFYMTQYPSYGNYYLETVRQLPQGTPLLLSWVLLGNVYPVTEDPGAKDNLHGKPCVEGFDSHYTLVSKPHYVPTPEGCEPDADELVVFRREQVLPRYLVYFSRTSRGDSDSEGGKKSRKKGEGGGSKNKESQGSASGTPAEGDATAQSAGVAEAVAVAVGESGVDALMPRSGGARGMNAEEATAVVAHSDSENPDGIVSGFYVMEQESSSASGGLLQRISTDGPVVLWVDPRPHSHVNKKIVSAVEKNTSVRFMQATTSQEAKVWLAQNDAVLSQLIARDLFRVITNRTRREGDHPPQQAGELFVEWLRGHGATSNVPVLLFCGRVDHRVAALHRPPRTLVADDATVAIKFASMEPLPSKDRDHCCVQ